MGLEPAFEEYINNLCDVFDEVWRKLKDNGTCWVNLGDTFNGSRGRGTLEKINPSFNRHRPSRKGTVMPKKHSASGIPQKCLMQIPSRIAIEMCNRGWILRNEIIWHKPNCMPSSVRDRFTVDYEKLFFFTKQPRYYFNQSAILEPLAPSSVRRLATNIADQKGSWRSNGGKSRRPMKATSTDGNRRNKRCVWRIAPASFRGDHHATSPVKLLEAPILAGCPPGGVVLDPFCGAGTTGVVAKKLDSHFIGIELNPGYIEIAKNRIAEAD